MRGALKKLTSAIGSVASIAGGFTGLPGIMAALTTGVNAIAKLSEGASKATGAEKAGIDKKLGALTNEVGQGLQQAQALVTNAAGGGNPIAAQASAGLLQAAEALKVFKGTIAAGQSQA